MLRTNLRGELTSTTTDSEEKKFNLTQKLKEIFYGFNVDAEVENFDDFILSALIINAVKKEDFKQLQLLHSLVSFNFFIYKISDSCDN